MNPFLHPHRRWLAGAALGATAALALAGCAKSTTAGAVASSSTAATTSPGSDAAFTLTSANVPGVGTVMVNGNGRTLYILSSEAGGKVTCTDASGCTAVWPDTELPTGKTAGIAGTGAQAARLGTVKNSDGKLYLTYGGFPLYTYVGDKAPGTANGQGIKSFGGTWTAVTPAGLAAAASPMPSPATSPATSPTKASSGGYGY